MNSDMQLNLFAAIAAQIASGELNERQLVEDVVMCPHLLVMVDSDEETLLHKAVFAAKPAAVQLLVNMVVDPTQMQFDSMPLLVLAVRNSTPEVVRVLSTHRELLEQKDGISGLTPLAWACIDGKSEAVRVLLAAGADYDAADDEMQRTPLHWAASKGHVENIKLLLNAGAVRQRRDRDGSTAETVAEEEGHADAAELIRNEPLSGQR